MGVFEVLWKDLLDLIEIPLFTENDNKVQYIWLDR